MSEEDINFLISIQDLEQPEFDNVYLERENERLRNQLQQKENIIKEVREEIIKDRKKSYGNLAKKAFYCNKTDKLLKILDKENKQ